MTRRELKKLSRMELLEMLLEQSREVERLRAELDAANAALADRKIKYDHAGTLAEAALAANGFFEAAEKAAKQYFENVTGSIEDEKTQEKADSDH